MYKRLRSSGHGESEVPTALPMRKVWETGRYVARPRRKRRTFRIGNQVLTQRKDTRKGRFR